MSRTLNLLFIATIGTAFCWTAAVYVDAEYNLYQQSISLLAVWFSLLLPAMVANFSKIHMISYRRRDKDFMTSAYLVLVVALLTIFPLVRITNFDSSQDQILTVLYAFAVFLTAAVFIFHVSRCGMKLLVGGFWIASVIGPLGYLLLVRSQGDLAELASVERRFSTEGMHPNLLGFCCAGFACTSICSIVFVRSRWHWLSLITGLVSLITVYLASSRGSIAAILVGIFVVSILMTLRLIRRALAGHVKALKILTALCGFCLLLGIVAMFAGQEILGSAIASEIYDRLQIFNQYRGMDSGLTGRVDTWRWVYSNYNAADFWLGVGPRKSRLIAGDIDNGYIVLILENGLLAGTIIIIRYIYVTLWLVWVSYRSQNVLEVKLALALVLMSVAFLINNLVARYLFGIGNPFCLYGLLLFCLGPTCLRLWLQDEQNVIVEARPVGSGFMSRAL